MSRKFERTSAPRERPEDRLLDEYGYDDPELTRPRIGPRIGPVARSSEFDPLFYYRGTGGDWYRSGLQPLDAVPRYHPGGPELENYSGMGPKGYQRSDERIHEDVCERLTQSPYIDAREIEVVVRDQEVTLTGSVPDRRMKRMAEDIAETVAGIVDIHNQLRISGLARSEEPSGQKAA